MQDSKVNMIPAAYAANFSAIGMDVEHNIIAVTDVSHTNASDISRISKRVRFEGEVKKELARVRATAMEGSFGTQKEHYGLKRISGRIKNTVTLIISLKEAMEYHIPISFIITFTTFCDANDAL